MSGGKKDALNQTVSFLSKRDGLDKVLKLGKYLSGLGIELNKKKNSALQGVAQVGGGGVDWSKLESALSLSRKAFRLGKFLNNVKKCRAILAETETDGKKKGEDSSSASEDERRRSRSVLLTLSLLFNLSEGAYYFLDQFQFLVKAKVVSKKSNAVAEVKRWATYFEILAYVADSACQCLLIKEQQEQKSKNEKKKKKKDHKQLLSSDGGEKEEKQREEEAERQIFESKVVLVQNAADFIMALNDVRQVDYHLGNPSFLALLGVLSAGIGIRSKWQ
jgi:hypothetical protein